MNYKCVCGHFLNNHHYGPIKEIFISRFYGNPVENRINCRDCDCPKYQRKHFWNRQKYYSLKEKK